MVATGVVVGSLSVGEADGPGVGVRVGSGLGVSLVGVAIAGGPVGRGGVVICVLVTGTVPVTPGVSPGRVGSGVGGTNWVGVASRITVGGTNRLLSPGVTVAVGVLVAVGVWVSAGRVGVAERRTRVGVGVICCWRCTRSVVRPSA